MDSFHAQRDMIFPIEIVIYLILPTVVWLLAIAAAR